MMMKAGISLSRRGTRKKQPAPAQEQAVPAKAKGQHYAQPVANRPSAGAPAHPRQYQRQEQYQHQQHQLQSQQQQYTYQQQQQPQQQRRPGGMNDSVEGQNRLGIARGPALPSAQPVVHTVTGPSNPYPTRRKPSPEEASLTTKNYRLAKELSELRMRHREECKNVTRLTMENMNLASRCREAISHVTMLKRELAMHQQRAAEALAMQRQQTQRMASNLSAGVTRMSQSFSDDEGTPTSARDSPFRRTPTERTSSTPPRTSASQSSNVDLCTSPPMRRQQIHESEHVPMSAPTPTSVQSTPNSASSSQSGGRSAVDLSLSASKLRYASKPHYNTPTKLAEQSIPEASSKESLGSSNTGTGEHASSLNAITNSSVDAGSAKMNHPGLIDGYTEEEKKVEDDIVRSPMLTIGDVAKTMDRAASGNITAVDSVDALVPPDLTGTQQQGTSLHSSDSVSAGMHISQAELVSDTFKASIMDGTGDDINGDDDDDDDVMDVEADRDDDDEEEDVVKENGDMPRPLFPFSASPKIRRDELRSPKDQIARYDEEYPQDVVSPTSRRPSLSPNPPKVEASLVRVINEECETSASMWSPLNGSVASTVSKDNSISPGSTPALCSTSDDSTDDGGHAQAMGVDADSFGARTESSSAWNTFQSPFGSKIRLGDVAGTPDSIAHDSRISQQGSQRTASPYDPFVSPKQCEPIPNSERTGISRSFSSAGRNRSRELLSPSDSKENDDKSKNSSRPWRSEATSVFRTPEKPKTSMSPDRNESIEEYDYSAPDWPKRPEKVVPATARARYEKALRPRKMTSAVSDDAKNSGVNDTPSLGSQRLGGRPPNGKAGNGGSSSGSGTGESAIMRRMHQRRLRQESMQRHLEEMEAKKRMQEQRSDGSPSSNAADAGASSTSIPHLTGVERGTIDGGGTSNSNRLPETMQRSEGATSAALSSHASPAASSHSNSTGDSSTSSVYTSSTPSSTRQYYSAHSSNNERPFDEDEEPFDAPSQRYKGPSLVERFKPRRNTAKPISYAEPALNTKLRRGHKYFPKAEPSLPPSGPVST